MTRRARAVRPRRSPGLVALLAAAALLSACGTRLPDAAFDPLTVGAGTVAGAVTSPDDATGVDPGGAGGTVEPGSATDPGADPLSGAGPAVASSAPGGRATAGPAAPVPAANTASDVGVTPTSIRLGSIASRSNAFDPTAFVGPAYGVQAFVDDVNRRGGIHGRRLELLTCDDHGDGSRNSACVHSLVDDSKVFALVGQAVLDYAGAAYVDRKGVPDVGSQPIDTAYDRYGHLWDLYGEPYPRDGTVGYDGKLEGGTEVYQFFSRRFPQQPRTAGVLYYNQAASQRYAGNLARGLRAEGYKVVEEEINFALPDYDSAVLDMRSQGVRYVYDALDSGGNQNLCAAMDAGGLSDQLVAKVTTTQSWTASTGKAYGRSPTCRNKIWATGDTQNYEDVRVPQVKAFRDAVARLHLDGPDELSEWSLEGWAGAQWLADAIGSCGAQVTRRCVEAYLARPTSYTGHGVLTPRDFVERPHVSTLRNCIAVARWQDSANGGKGGWVSQVADPYRNCFDAKMVLYTP